VLAAVDAGDEPALGAVEVVRTGRTEVFDHSAANEVDLEEARRHGDYQGVRPACERDGRLGEDLLLIRRVDVELS